MFFFTSLDYQDSDAAKKVNGFLPQKFLASAMAQSEFMMEELEPVLAEDFLAFSWDVALFGIIGLSRHRC